MPALTPKNIALGFLGVVILAGLAIVFTNDRYAPAVAKAPAPAAAIKK